MMQDMKFCIFPYQIMDIHKEVSNVTGQIENKQKITEHYYRHLFIILFYSRIF